MIRLKKESDNSQVLKRELIKLQGLINSDEELKHLNMVTDACNDTITKSPQKQGMSTRNVKRNDGKKKDDVDDGV